MPKSKIIIDIVEEKVPLVQSLNRLLLLSKDINNKQLEEWVTREINGYGSGEEVPEYRKTKVFELVYSGINGSFQTKNVTLNKGWINKEYLDKFSELHIC